MHPRIIFILLFLISNNIFCQSKLQRQNVSTTIKDSASIKLRKDSLVENNKVEKLNNESINSEVQNVGYKVFKDILPILTLLLGILINRILDYIKERKNINKTGNRWLAELNLLLLPINNQIKEIDRYNNELNKNKSELPSLKFMIGLNGESLKSIDKGEVIKFLECKLDKKTNEVVGISNQLHFEVDISKYNYELIISKFNEFKTATSSYYSQLNTSLQNINTEISNYIQAIEIELASISSNDPRIKPIIELLNSEFFPYQEKGNWDVFILREKFFKPLIEHLYIVRHDSRTQKLSDEISNANNSIKGIEMEQYYLSRNLLSIKNELEKNEIKLKELLEKFK